MYASNTSKEIKVILCMLGRILLPELLLLICRMGCTCPIGFPLPLLPLSVIS